MIRHRQNSVDGSSQFILPFAEKEYVTVRRTGRILGVSDNTVYRVAGLRGRDDRPLLNLVNYRKNSRHRVLYSSIVRFCDGLRQSYGIPDRRPTLSNPIFRHKDEDLLPFRLSDTMYSAEALAALGYESRSILLHLIEEGRFEAYRIMPTRGTEWRISRPSFRLFLDQTRDRDKQPKRSIMLEGALNG